LGVDQWADSEVLLRTWLRRAREGQHGHHEAGKAFRRADYWLKIPIVIITTALGTAAFATLTVNVPGAAKICFGLMSILAAVLASLQVHLRYAERAERHKNLGAQYGALRRRIEALLAVPRDARGNPSDVLDELRYKLDAIADEGEAVSRRVWDRTRARLAAQDELATEPAPKAAVAP
jgi:hypothetical protein